MTSFWLFTDIIIKPNFFMRSSAKGPRDIEAMRVKLAVFTNTENSKRAKNSIGICVINDFKKCLSLFY